MNDRSRRVEHSSARREENGSSPGGGSSGDAFLPLTIDHKLKPEPQTITPLPPKKGNVGRKKARNALSTTVLGQQARAVN